MNEPTHTFMKICISHTLFSMFLWRVRDEWRQGQTAILTQLLLLTVAALFHILAGIAQPGVAEDHTALSLQAGLHSDLPVTN